jgi:peptidoglycan/xylan/chitin deacetylase (PgdA/CDA1 family)
MSGFGDHADDRVPGRPDAATVDDGDQGGGLNRRRFLIGAGTAVGIAAGWSASRLGALGTAGVGHPAIGTGLANRGPSIQAVPMLPAPYRWSPGDFLMNVALDGDRRMMALTFDDGPSPYNTRSILRTLANRNITATFFMIGVNVRSWPDIAREVAEAGHEIGNHSVYHTPYRSYDLSRQIGPNQEIIQSATGTTPLVNRAPGLTRGSSILDVCRQHGMYECHTNMATYDWLSPRHSAGALYSEFVRHQTNGAFVLYHDGGGRRPTPDALPSIVDYGISQGYTFVTATELTTYGSPVPGRNWYPQSIDAGATGDVPQAIDVASPGAPEAEYVDVCGYDARLELEQRLDDPTIRVAERSRIVEALAEMDAGEADADQ